jgi:hypothetical protein
MISMAIAAAVALAVSACGGHRATFKPGDHVIRKLTGERAIVAVRMRPFADDIYWLKMHGGPEDNDVLLGALAAPGEHTKYNWHFEGRFYEDDLVLSHD